MNVREGPPQPAPPHQAQRQEQEPPPYPAEKARGGEIVLRSRVRRAIFLSGLIGAFLFALFVAYLAMVRAG